MTTLLRDLQYALRQLRENSGFAFTAIVVLGLGIGASVAIFSAVNPILFEPLPYPDPGRIVMVWYTAEDGSRIPQTFHTFREVTERNRSFDLTAVMKPWQPTLTGAEQPQRLEGQRVSERYFRVLGVSPILGRDFQASDDVLNGPRVVIISNGLWRRFGSDRTVIGRQIKLDDDNYTIIGVMPGFFENVLAPSSEVWSPLQYNRGNIVSQQTREWGHHLRMIARLRDGVSLDQARSDLAAIAHAAMAAFPRPPWASLQFGMAVNSLQHDMTNAVRPALVAVLGAVILVLVIACVNATNLLLAHGAQRQREFAMRAALGAGRQRLVQQLLTESLLLAIFGGVFGLVIAQLGVRALVALSPAELPRLNAIRMDTTVFLFALATTAIVGVMVGMIPALHASRRDLHMGLQQSSMRTAGGHQWTRRTLVVVEVGIALVLLVSAGLLLRTLQQLFATDPGFDSSSVLTMQVQVSGHQFDSENAKEQFFTEALEAVRQVPGVSAAAFTSQLPLSGDFESYGVQFASDPNNSEAALRYAVSPDYFQAMRIPVLRGRLLSEHDKPGSPVAVVLSQSFAKRKFPGTDPLGQRIRIGENIGRADRPWGTVVGVVGDVKQASLALSETDAFYSTPPQWSWWVDNVQSLVVRVRGDAAAFAPVVQQAIWSVDKNQPIMRVATMDDLVAKSETERHFVLILFEAFALVALLLAATGIYGVLSGSVTERTREIGLRTALGATPLDVIRLVVREAIVVIGIGIVIGIAGALLASRALVSLIIGVHLLDPVTYALVIVLLAGVSLIASGVPAWRASKVDPCIMLRAE